MSEWLKSQWKPGSPHIASTGGGGTPWCGYGCGADGYDVDYTAECPGPKPKSQPVPPRTTEGLTAEQAEAALRVMVRELHAVGKVAGCRLLSRAKLGLACDCPLCLIDLIADRNQPETINLRREVESIRAALAQRTEEAQKWETLAMQRWNEIQAHVQVVLKANERLKQLEAELAQAREQRDAVLRDVAKLPDPVFGFRWALNRKPVLCCQWCGVEWESSGDLDIPNTPHPDNDCLWPRALAASGRGSAPQGDSKG